MHQRGEVDGYRRTRSSRGDLDTPGVHAPAGGVIGQPARQQIMANDRSTHTFCRYRTFIPTLRLPSRALLPSLLLVIAGPAYDKAKVVHSHERGRFSLLIITMRHGRLAFKLLSHLCGLTRCIKLAPSTRACGAACINGLSEKCGRWVDYLR